MKNSTIVIVLVLAVITLGVVLMTSRGSNATSATPTPSPTISPSPTPMIADAVTASQVVLKTDKGNITLNLYKNDTPNTVKNFVTLGKRGYYDGIIFHRVIKDFVIQGGDPTGTGSGGSSIYGAKFADETNKNHAYQKGSIGMANSGANTNGSQFYIVTNDVTAGNLSALTPDKYTLFGQVSDDASMAVVTAIASVPTDPSTDKPLTDVKITGFDITQP